MSVLVGSWALISSSGNAGTQDYAKRFKTYECSNKTLRGTYGGQMQGARPAPGGGLEQLIGVVIRTYDGAGNFTQVDNIKGSVAGIVPDRPGSGTYSVSADCSFTTQFQPGPGVLIEETGNIVDYGNEVQSITVTPQPLMVTGSAKRIGFR
ncbi:MAG: hypothetical protein ACJ8MR_02435 [Povalibacter sp.]